MKLLLSGFLLIMVFTVLQAAPQHSLSTVQPKPGAAKQPFTRAGTIVYKLIAAPGNTYGYDIYSNGRLLIHQPSIPCVQGDKGFSTKKDAGKVAMLAIEKINKGIMPPSLTLQELKSLGVLH